MSAKENNPIDWVEIEEHLKAIIKKYPKKDRKTNKEKNNAEVKEGKNSIPHWLSVDKERDKRFRIIVDNILAGYYGPTDGVPYIVTENMVFILLPLK